MNTIQKVLVFLIFIQISSFAKDHNIQIMLGGSYEVSPSLQEFHQNISDALDFEVNRDIWPVFSSTSTTTHSFHGQANFSFYAQKYFKNQGLFRVAPRAGLSFSRYLMSVEITNDNTGSQFVEKKYRLFIGPILSIMPKSTDNNFIFNTTFGLFYSSEILNAQFIKSDYSTHFRGLQGELSHRIGYKKGGGEIFVSFTHEWLSSGDKTMGQTYKEWLPVYVDVPLEINTLQVGIRGGIATYKKTEQ